MTDQNNPPKDVRMAKAMHYLFVILLSLVWTTVVVFRTLYDFIRIGTDKMLFRKERTETPKVLLDPFFKHDTVKLSQVSLHYAHAGDRSKPLMLFLHGFPEFWYSWRFQMREFAADYWCVALDMRGYNLSDKPKGLDNYDMKWLTQDVRETVEALGRESCVLVSHDWGSAVAWATAARYPEIVDKLIVMNVPHKAAFEKHMRSGTSQLLKSWYMFYFQCPYLPEFVMRLQDYKALEQFFRGPAGGIKNKENFTDDDLEAWKYTYSQAGFTAPLNYYRSMMQTFKAPSGKKPTKIQPPVLIVWGTADVALDAVMAEMSVDHCEKATLQFVQGASHWVQQDDPQKVNQHMHEFLEG